MIDEKIDAIHEEISRIRTLTFLPIECNILFFVKVYTVTKLRYDGN